MAGRGYKCGSSIVTFQDELAAEQFISSRVGCSIEFGKNLEVGLLDGDGSVRCLAIFQHEKIAQEWLGTFEVSSFTKSRP